VWHESDESVWCISLNWQPFVLSNVPFLRFMGH